MPPTSTTAELSIPQLRKDLHGRVIGPEDADYDKARTVVIGGIDRHPAVIARVADDADVSHVVGLARDTGLPLSVKSGGHSSVGHSTNEGGIVIDLADLNALDIDVDGHTAWAQTGLTAGAYTTAAAEHGLATGFGDTASVGIGGLTLGGGIGYLVRKYGLTVDDLLAADIVTADGEVVRVDATSHPELFWAIRGGGGNFGVATRFQYRLHDVPSVFGGMLFLPATVETITGFVAAAEAAPEELSTIANIMPAPPMPFLDPQYHGKLTIMGMLVYAGSVEDGQKAVAPFRALATPFADMLRPMGYPEVYPPEQGEYHPIAAARTMFLDSVDDSQAEKILDHLGKSDAMMRVTQLRVLGGAMARVPAEATAFAHRDSRIMANLAAVFEDTADRDRHERWVNGFVDELRQSDKGAYVNFLADEGERGVRSAYPGATWDRLAAVKAKYDPTNLFRMNQNIPPSNGRS